MYDNEKLLSMSLDELDLLIGESQMEGELGMKPVSNAEKRQASQLSGQGFLTRKWSDLRWFSPFQNFQDFEFRMKLNKRVS